MIIKLLSKKKKKLFSRFVTIRTRTDLENHMGAIKKNKYYHYPLHRIYTDELGFIKQFDNYECNDEQFGKLCSLSITESDLKKI